MFKLRSENGQHIVTYNGHEFFFNTLQKAWENIFIVLEDKSRGN